MGRAEGLGGGTCTPAVNGSGDFSEPSRHVTGEKMDAKRRKEMRAERERGRQWQTAADAMFWMKGDPGAVERIITANAGRRERTKSQTEEELEVVTGKRPLCYTDRA